MRSRTVQLNLSLFHSQVDASNYELVMSDVMLPVHERLCQKSFFVLTSKEHGGSLCPPTISASTEHSTEDLTAEAFEDDDETILRAVPVMVTDRHYKEVHWTAWSISFFVMQIGDGLMERLTNDSREENRNKADQAVELIQEVLQTTFREVIAAGKLDEELGHILPGAHFSLTGEEQQTWSKFSVLEADDPDWTSLLVNGTAQHHLIDGAPSLPGPMQTIGESHRMGSFGPSFFAVAFLLAMAMAVLRRNKHPRLQPVNHEYTLMRDINDIELRSVEAP